MDDIQAGYVEKGILIIRGVVDDKMADYVTEALDLLFLAGSPDITLLISSPGGDARAGLDIIDSLLLYPGGKIAIVVGQASSMAAIILQCCTLRLATPNSEVLIHHATAMEIKIDILRDSEKRERFLIEVGKMQKRLDEILIKRTKRSAEEIDTECKKDRIMTAEEAVTFGLLDGIHLEPLSK